jgi:hypothetical protein
MYNLVTGFLVMFCAVSIGLSVAQQHAILAVIYFVAGAWFYSRLEKNTFKD